MAFYAVVAGLTILTYSCREKAPVLQLLETRTLTDFPSASAIEYHNNKLYVFGDDASYMLILDTLYNRIDTIQYTSDTAYRINPGVKPDIESATLIRHNDEFHLYALGSFSSNTRRNLYYFPLAKPHDFLKIDYSGFVQKLGAVPELNIEGMALVKSKLVFTNRANNSNRTNKFIIGGNSLYEYKSLPPPALIDIRIDSTKVIGISGLYYVEDKDLMLFTASEEDTPNALQDGTINDSYIGWISRFSLMMEDKTIKPDKLIKLTGIDPVFAKQKIESVCVQRYSGQEMILHLVADNDNGESKLFRLRLVL